MLKIGIVAGESSGDQLGAQLISNLRERYPDVSIVGMAGPKMRAAGCEVIADIEELSVMGIVEVLQKYPTLRRLRTRLINDLTDLKLDLFIGIDVPDFVHHIERKLKSKGVKTVHYVAPQVWAWRPKRARRLSATVDLLLVLFPFELDFFTRHGVRAKFVGHPLVDEIPERVDRESILLSLGLPNEDAYVALMPGSRRQELRRHVDLFLATASTLSKEYPKHRFLVAAVNEDARRFIEDRAVQICPDLNVHIVAGRSHEILAVAEVALAVSGTVTMEAMCTKTPTVVAIRLAEFSYQILKRLVTVPFVAMPNILAGKKIMPEFVQAQATVENLSVAMSNWIKNPTVVADYKGECVALRGSLRATSNGSAAQEISKLLSQPQPQPEMRQ